MGGLLCAREQTDCFLLRKQPHSLVWLRSGNLPWWQEPQAARGKSREVPRAAEWWWHVPPHPALKEDSFAKLLTDQKLATGAFQGKDIPKMETHSLFTSGQVTVLMEGGGGVRSGAELGGPK